MERRGGTSTQNVVEGLQLVIGLPLACEIDVEYSRRVTLGFRTYHRLYNINGHHKYLPYCNDVFVAIVFCVSSCTTCWCVHLAVGC